MICKTCKRKPWLNSYMRECLDCLNIYSTLTVGDTKEKADMLIHFINSFEAKIEALEKKIAWVNKTYKTLEQYMPQLQKIPDIEYALQNKKNIEHRGDYY